MSREVVLSEGGGKYPSEEKGMLDKEKRLRSGPVCLGQKALVSGWTG